MGGCVSVKPEETVVDMFAKSLTQHQTQQDEYAYLSNITHFDEDTLRLLHVRFNAIDSSIVRDSRISLKEFAKIIKMSPDSILVTRFFKYMDGHNLGGLTFRIFATTMSILSKQASEIEKIKLSFYLCDLNDDGYIDRNELIDIIKDCLSEIEPLNVFKHYCDSMNYINIILQNTFKQMNISETETTKISFQQYYQFITNNNQYKQRILSAFSIDINKLIQYEAESRRLVMISNKEIIDKNKILHHGPLLPSHNSYNVTIEKIYDYLIQKSISNKIESVQSIHDPSQIMCD